jgi:MFS family permease
MPQNARPTRSARPEATPGIFSRPYLVMSLGMCSLIVLSAFESLAVTTVMPIISRQLDGSALYALAFAAPLAVGVVGMVIAGNWSDRSGPVAPLYLSVAFFVAGLLVAGTAVNMPILVAGRLVQGLGGGAMIVALYVLVARVYPTALHPRIFAAFAAAWVVPALIGPLIAGLIAEAFSWHWVFLGVAAVSIPAMAMVVPALRLLERRPPDLSVAVSFSRFAWAALAAAAVLALNLSGELPDPLGWILPVLSAAIAIAALRPLLPTGALRAWRGLPSVIAIRGLVSAAFFGTEVYVPYLLQRNFGLTAATAGLALSVSGITWAAASWFQARISARVDTATTLRIGIAFVLLAIVAAFATATLELSPVIPIIGWASAGAGMGFMWPRLATRTLELSTPANQGFNSSALSISDSIGSAISVAVTGVVFTSLVGLSAAAPFAGCFATTFLVGVLALVVSGRVRPRTA